MWYPVIAKREVERRTIMKKVLLYLIACSMLMFGCSCQANEASVACDSLTEKYDLAELTDYFQKRNANDSALTGVSSNLCYNDVNVRFPIELTRPEGYSVYKVSQGGLYYVFWSEIVDTDTDISKLNPAVYFSSYISSENDASAFKSLQVGISTAEDVKKIDPFFELSFMESSGVFSYSFLNDAKVIQIEYSSNSNINSFKDLKVKDISVLPRKESASRYSTVLSQDLLLDD